MQQLEIMLELEQKILHIQESGLRELEKRNRKMSSGSRLKKKRRKSSN